MTRIERLQKTGILRQGDPEHGFRYERSDERHLTAEDQRRIEALRIPPAWTEVAINAAAKGSLQAVGKDAAGRWQYLYHHNHIRKQESRKFQRLIKFAEALPKMRATVNRNLKQRGLRRERVMAAILRILSTCFMRPGSQVYASEHGSYGIATLRRKHVKVKGELVEFDFPGKSGVRQLQQMHDRQVAKVVRALLKYPGPALFRYQNGDAELVNVRRRHVNEYIKEVMGDKFSAKDFRTWAGTLLCASALARVGTEMVEKPTVRKRKVVAAIKETAALLGNTPAVCRSSYISPTVVDSFQRGKMIDNYFPTLDDFMSYKGKKLHPAEASLLKFLKGRAAR